MNSGLSKYYGALKATGGSPASGDVPLIGKFKNKSGGLSFTKGSARKRLAQAYMGFKTSQERMMSK